MITVRHLGGPDYEVRISGASETVHQVCLQDQDRLRLAGRNISPDKLIEESFRFLLEREPNTSILRSFELPVIGRYFPEYEHEIRRRLQNL